MFYNTQIAPKCSYTHSIPNLQNNNAELTKQKKRNDK